jgi:spore maturation protein CgeB
MRIVFLGLSITSSWGNGHATNYRALVKALRARGHDVLFLERDMPWYAAARDAPGAAELYDSVEDLATGWVDDVREAELVVLGSYVPEGAAVGEWLLGAARGLTAFYDIDTPVTLARLEAGDPEYLVPELVPRFDLYLSFTGGPTLDTLEQRWGARRARAFHCLVDEEEHRPETRPRRWLLGYLGTYSPDRQPALEELLLEPARRLPRERFVVAGSGYPAEIVFPDNVRRIDHLPPLAHRRFYAEQAFTLNVTRVEMLRAGWSPSVRLFEAAACGIPVVSDRWPGLERFFVPGREILVAGSADEVVGILRRTGPEERHGIGARARRRVLAGHTAAHRAAELERHVAGAVEARA